jgi:hypothetical protein
MKRILGVVLLILAALVAVNVAEKLSQPAGFPQTRSSAYNAGHTAGMLTVPVVLGIAGLWLVLTSLNRDGSSFFPVNKALQGLRVMAALLMVVVVALYLYGAHRARMRRAEMFHPPAPVSSPVTVGPYNVGDKVQASWGGKWTSGKITTINPGGFSLMVQLDDPRFPQPIVLSTNQIRSE